MSSEDEDETTDNEEVVGMDIAFTPANKALKKSSSGSISSISEENKKRRQKMADRNSIAARLKDCFDTDDKLFESERKLHQIELKLMQVENKIILVDLYKKFKALGFSNRKCLHLEPALKPLLED